ncbi:hypothetical protein Desti_0189 [Desulfomonile tiedjei DSM 6799]|uniref:Uncharacterized protein n=1 Tax=Desulfomonile tiedjei (strain ATCC 49306 / DSM 6799 / DCB-1) TaxID=706587 RepID=I4C044_DESTA|nr:hypothetical protein Desti_0189 [Desulfomonile tiedjei DSM 6799]
MNFTTKKARKTMKIECPECYAQLSIDEFPDFPSEHICTECGACFELESHLCFEEASSEADQARIPRGE